MKRQEFMRNRSFLFFATIFCAFNLIIVNGGLILFGHDNTQLTSIRDVLLARPTFSDSWGTQSPGRTAEGKDRRDSHSNRLQIINVIEVAHLADNATACRTRNRMSQATSGAGSRAREPRQGKADYAEADPARSTAPGPSLRARCFDR